MLSEENEESGEKNPSLNHNPSQMDFCHTNDDLANNSNNHSDSENEQDFLNSLNDSAQKETLSCLTHKTQISIPKPRIISFMTSQQMESSK